MSTAAITRQLDEHGDRLPGFAGHRQARASALARFSELGLPGRRVETWHYTDLSSMADKDFRYIAPAPDSATLERVQELLADHQLAQGRSRQVFVDGHWIESLSHALPDAKVQVNRLPGPAANQSDDTALECLNSAFAGEAVRVSLTGTSELPIELTFIGSGQLLAPQVRLEIELAAGSKATVIQHFLDLPEADESWLNLVMNIRQAENSVLNLWRLQTHGSGQYQTSLHRAYLAENSTLSAGNIELGGQLVRNEFEIALDGHYAEAHVFGLALTKQRQHADMRISADHRSAHTTSRQDYRTIVADRSRAVFNGKVIVQEQAQHIDARQKNDNLLLSSQAEVDTKPELEIYADQVVCSHGATVGELSDDALFYLRARGIDEQSARGILTTAFANTIIDRFELDDFRESVRAAVHARLPERVADQ